VSHTAHGLATGDEVSISGVDQSEYHGVKTITVTGVNSYTFTVTGTPATPATGTPVATAVIMTGSTDSNGKLSITDFNYTNDQPIYGVIRKAT